jgi:hypothetical protein
MLELLHRCFTRAIAHTARHRKGEWQRCAGSLTQSCGECTRRHACCDASTAWSLLRCSHQSNSSSRTRLSFHPARRRAAVRLTPPPTPIDRTNPLHPFYSGEGGPSFAAEQLIHRELHEVTLNNVFQSCTTLRHELEEQLGLVVSKSTVHRWLHALGYVYALIATRSFAATSTNMRQR